MCLYGSGNDWGYLYDDAGHAILENTKNAEQQGAELRHQQKRLSPPTHPSSPSPTIPSSHRHLIIIYSTTCASHPMSLIKELTQRAASRALAYNGKEAARATDPALCRMPKTVERPPYPKNKK